MDEKLAIKGLQLSRPFCQIDLETTGTDPSQDRITQIAVLKVMPELNPDGTNVTIIKNRLINPGMPIPAGAAEITGINDEAVKDAPKFASIANNLLQFLMGCDLGGFNFRWYDLPLLAEEFHRVGINDFPAKGTRVVDSLNIFKDREKRNLTAAYKFYCGKDLEGAHNAEVDITATHEVLLGQLNKYPDLGKDIESLSKIGEVPNQVDLSGRFVMNESGQAVFNFGKYNGQIITKSKDHVGYLDWIINGGFSLNTKYHASKIKADLMG